MKHLKNVVVTLTVALSALTASAEGVREARVRELIQPRLGLNATIAAVTETPYSGLFEIRVGSNMFYTDEQGKYLFVGRILDVNTGEDYTKARMDEINKISFAELPLNSAIKTVKGNGKRVIAVFEDPNCGYCKRFNQTLKEVDDVTVYTFLYNILSPDSAAISRNVWCTKNRANAWAEWMLDEKRAPAAPADCNAPNDQILALGRRLNVTGTPTIFFSDGSRIPGAADAKELEARLISLK
jgi:thiol:disulfide interchange protein DsbC